MQKISLVLSLTEHSNSNSLEYNNSSNNLNSNSTVQINKGQWKSISRPSSSQFSNSSKSNNCQDNSNLSYNNKFSLNNNNPNRLDSHSSSSCPQYLCQLIIPTTSLQMISALTRVSLLLSSRCSREHPSKSSRLLLVNSQLWVTRNLKSITTTSILMKHSHSNKNRILLLRQLNRGKMSYLVLCLIENVRIFRSLKA